MGHGFSMIYSKQGYGGYVINTMIYVPLLLDFVFTSDLKIFWKLNFEKHARKKKCNKHSEFTLGIPAQISLTKKIVWEHLDLERN